MKRRAAAGAMMAAVLGVVLAGGPGAAAAEGDVQGLAWMQGRWTGEKDGVTFEEYWTDPAGGAMLGLHRDIKGGRLVSWEFMRIGATPEGTFYFASPGSKPPTPFKLVQREATRVVFENKQHDFPQRILYWLDEKEALHARVEGPQGGTTVSEEWVWTKAR
jgi:hypothetical protein